MRLIAVLFICAILSCKKSSSPQQPLPPPFVPAPVLHQVSPGVIDEASGLADSHMNPGYLWVNQDSQQPAELYLLSHNGQHGQKISITNAINRDWEEVVVGEGPVAGKKYIYIGDVGDNDEVHTEYAIYRLEEPVATSGGAFAAEKIRFKYPDGSHDAEAMFVDSLTKDIYIITKRGTVSKMYRLAYPQSTTVLNTAMLEVSLPYSGVVAAAYSATQKELLIKTYTSIYYYQNPQATSPTALLEKPIQLTNYQPEPQGEAICFANDRSGFFTLSEKAQAGAVNLRFYKRL